MKIPKTRIRVEKSGSRTTYHPEFKTKFLWFDDWMEFGDMPIGESLTAWLRVDCRKDKPPQHSRRWAEMVCEEYHKILESEWESQKHERTKCVSYYDYPED